MKQLTIFKLAKGSVSADGLEANRFAPIGPTQTLSVGFVPPRGNEHDPLMETVAGHHILSVAIETKSVPARVLQEKLDEACKHIEETTGRKPGKKERKALKEDLLLALLPTAFPKRVDIQLWIDPSRQRVIVGSTSTSKVDEVVTALVKSMDIGLQRLNTMRTPATSMRYWLLANSEEDLPEGLAIGREAVLKSNGEDAAIVKFSNHYLMTPEVRQHIAEGKMPTALSLRIDDRTSFVLTEGGSLKKVLILDVPESKDDEDAFDADVAITTGTLGPVIDSLIAHMGGEGQLHPEEGGAA